MIYQLDIFVIPFMVLGTTLCKFMHLLGVHIKAKEKEKCISCSSCNEVCPMGIDAVNKIKNDVIDNLECIQCVSCIDNCPKHVMFYGMIEGKENDYGK